MTGQFTFDDPFAKLNQRITDLENLVRQVAGGPKLGLADTGLASVDAYWEMSAAGLGTFNWEDDAVGGGTASVTLTTGSRVIALASWTADDFNAYPGVLAGDDYTSATVVGGVGYDSTPPTTLGYAYAQIIVNADTAEIAIPCAFSTFITDLEPGEHTFKLQFYADSINPANTTYPLLGFQRLMIIPLGWQ